MTDQKIPNNQRMTMKTISKASCVVLGLLAGTASAQEYEFKILTTEGVPTVATLNKAGSDGWHIRQIVTAPSENSVTEREYQVFMQRDALPGDKQEVVFCNNKTLKYCFPRTKDQIAVLTDPLSKCYRTSYSGDFDKDDPTEFLTTRDTAQNFDTRFYRCMDYDAAANMTRAKTIYGYRCTLPDGYFEYFASSGEMVAKRDSAATDCTALTADELGWE